MRTSRNPARSRPLSRNVKRLMKLARESTYNPSVEKVERRFSTRELAYCDMQGNIFMAAVDRGLTMEEFAPLFMMSQLAGVIDYSFSRSGGMESDDVSKYLRMPMLLKSPALIVDTLIWLDEIVSQADPNENLGMVVARALEREQQEQLGIPTGMGLSEREQQDQLGIPTGMGLSLESDVQAEEDDSGGGEFSNNNSGISETKTETLVEDYEYAYWLGYIYRCECHMHDESSRMVYGAFDEHFMRELYKRLELNDDATFADSAVDICNLMDVVLVEGAWK